MLHATINLQHTCPHDVTVVPSHKSLCALISERTQLYMHNKTKQKILKLQHKSISINPDSTTCYTKNK